MKKKILAFLLLAAVCMTALSACGNDIASRTAPENPASVLYTADKTTTPLSVGMTRAEAEEIVGVGNPDCMINYSMVREGHTEDEILVSAELFSDAFTVYGGLRVGDKLEDIFKVFPNAVQSAATVMVYLNGTENVAALEDETSTDAYILAFTVSSNSADSSASKASGSDAASNSVITSISFGDAPGYLTLQ